MAIVAFGFQEGIYQTESADGVQLLYAGDLTLRLGVLTLVSGGFLWFSQRVFAGAQGNFAQEL
jgi:ABC-2 type transport system permease protein